jgi:hypothetical protein
MVTNWKTTIPGILNLGFVIYHIWQTKTIDATALQQALIGAGLIAAKDFNVTGDGK